MNERLVRIAGELGLPSKDIESTAALLDGGATVPFIARYRKEATGSMDEVAILKVKERLAQLRQLDERRETMLASLVERGLLTDELGQTLRDTRSLTELEDLYLPHRPRRRTRATQAIEKGLEPLAQVLWAQPDIDPEHEAAAYIDDGKGVPDTDSALAGARDIMAQWVSEDAVASSRIRSLFARQAVLRSRVVKGREEEAQKYRDYFESEELLASAPSHRVLAVFRGESEGMLTTRIQPSDERAIAMLEDQLVHARSHLELGGTAGGGDHRGPQELAELDRHQADAAPGAMHQEGLAGAERAALHQPVVTGAVGDGEGGAVLEAHALGHGIDGRRGRHHLLGEATVAVVGKHPVARTQTLDLGPDLDHLAGRFDPRAEREGGTGLVFAGHQQQIGEIYAVDELPSVRRQGESLESVEGHPGARE